jgi:hypothetical protein
MNTEEDHGNIGLPAEWTHIRTGEAYTLTGLSNLHSENRATWPVMAHYTGADGCRWTRTLVSFLGAMQAGRQAVWHFGKDSIGVVVTTMESGANVEPEEVPVSTSAHEWEDERWVRDAADGMWSGPGSWVIYSDFDDALGMRYAIHSHADGDAIEVFDTPQDAAERGESLIAEAKSVAEIVPAVTEPDVVEATSGLPEGWREVVPGRVWSRGDRGIVVVRDMDPESSWPYAIYASDGHFDCSYTLDDAIKAADDCCPVSEYP